jgi:riboflavin synthase
MFTGIIQAVGQIVTVQPLAAGVHLLVDVAQLPIDDVALGDSIAIQGACMTVVSRQGQVLGFDVSRESLDCTVGLSEPGPVNLEKALCLGERMGGHLVTGHVDGLGTVRVFEARGESWHLAIQAPEALARYLARKGSVTVNGVSLTVNQVRGARFELNIIPHTLAVTTLSRLAPGALVNLEVDLIARYVERMVSAEAGQPHND